MVSSMFSSCNFSVQFQKDQIQCTTSGLTSNKGKEQIGRPSQTLKIKHLWSGTLRITIICVKIMYHLKDDVIIWKSCLCLLKRESLSDQLYPSRGYKCKMNTWTHTFESNTSNKYKFLFKINKKEKYENLLYGDLSHKSQP